MNSSVMKDYMQDFLTKMKENDEEKFSPLQAKLEEIDWDALDKLLKVPTNQEGGDASE